MGHCCIAVALACGFLAAGASAARAAESGKGKLLFNTHCRTCHALDEGDHRLGPSLYNIVGKEAGTSEGFANYSQAMRSSEIVWDEQTLDAFIATPDKVVRGNNMKPYAGIPEADTRAQIVEYLKSESQN